MNWEWFVRGEGRMLVLGCLFFGAFVIPFSLSQFQLPHYIHPTYLALTPTAVWAWQRMGWIRAFQNRSILAATSLAGILVWVLMILTTPPFSGSSNRGVEFSVVQSSVLALGDEKSLRIHPREVDAYRAEANTLWYWRGRPWQWADLSDSFEFPFENECRFSPDSRTLYCR
jgi:hypothetical protein